MKKTDNSDQNKPYRNIQVLHTIVFLFFSWGICYLITPCGPVYTDKVTHTHLETAQNNQIQWFLLDCSVEETLFFHVSHADILFQFKRKEKQQLMTNFIHYSQFIFTGWSGEVSNSCLKDEQHNYGKDNTRFLKSDSWGYFLSLLPFLLLTDFPLPQCDHHLSWGVHSMCHSGKFCQSQAWNSLQHVHVCLPVPAAAGHHDHLLHQDLLWDLQTTEKRQLWVGTAFWSHF